MKKRLTAGVLLLSGLALSACDSSSGGAGAAVTRAVNSFGSIFASAFNASANSDPVQVQASDLTLTPKADPVDF